MLCGMADFRKLLYIAVLAVALFVGGCAKPVVQHPGALNNVDNVLYDTLLTEQAALNQAKIDVPKYPALVPTFNTVAAQYNATKDAFKTYHGLVAAGGNPDPAALQAQVAATVASISKLIAQLGGKL